MAYSQPKISERTPKTDSFVLYDSDGWIREAIIELQRHAPSHNGRLPSRAEIIRSLLDAELRRTQGKPDRERS